MTKIKVIVDKDILKESCMCGINRIDDIGNNCAVALAIKKLLPQACVGNNVIFPKGLVRTVAQFLEDSPTIKLPTIARDFILQFEESSCSERLEMSPIEFEIEIPDSVLETIGDMEEVKKLINSSSTLELV